MSQLGQWVISLLAPPLRPNLTSSIWGRTALSQSAEPFIQKWLEAPSSRPRQGPPRSSRGAAEHPRRAHSAAAALRRHASFRWQKLASERGTPPVQRLRSSTALRMKGTKGIKWGNSECATSVTDPTPPCRGGSGKPHKMPGPPRWTLPGSYQSPRAGCRSGCSAPVLAGRQQTQPRQKEQRSQKRGPSAEPPRLPREGRAEYLAWTTLPGQPSSSCRKARPHGGEASGRTVALPEDGVALCGPAAPEKRLGSPVRPFRCAAAEGKVGVRGLWPGLPWLRRVLRPLWRSLSLSCRSHYAGQGAPAERPGFRPQGEAGARCPLHRLFVLGLGRTLWPGARVVFRPQPGSSGGGCWAGSCGGDGAREGPRWRVLLAAHVSRSVGATARHIPGAVPKRGDGFLFFGNGLGAPESEFCPFSWEYSAAAAAPGHRGLAYCRCVRAMLWDGDGKVKFPLLQ